MKHEVRAPSVDRGGLTPIICAAVSRVSRPSLPQRDSGCKWKAFLTAINAAHYFLLGGETSAAIRTHWVVSPLKRKKKTKT